MNCHCRDVFWGDERQTNKIINGGYNHAGADANITHLNLGWENSVYHINVRALKICAGEIIAQHFRVGRARVTPLSALLALPLTMSCVYMCVCACMRRVKNKKKALVGMCVYFWRDMTSWC